MTTSTDLHITQHGHVTQVDLCRPPHNFFDHALIRQLADVFEQLDATSDCRAIVLAAQGSSFCAGANFNDPNESVSRDSGATMNPIYHEALRIFACRKPIVVAVQGPAIGGGLGVALVGDFRVACEEARFSANFTRLGFHPGFGLSVTLPRLVGLQAAQRLFFVGERINGRQALEIGLVDELVPKDQLLERALGLAQDIALSAPIAIESVRTTLRQGLVEQLRAAVTRESVEQYQHFKTEDFKEGVRAMTERRPPRFQRR
jgi:enoyl-CoA hydratase/carnithine racemase